MKIRLSLSWIILILLLAGIVTTAWSGWLRSNSLETIMRQSLVDSEMQVTRSVLASLEDEIGSENWTAISNLLPNLQRTTSSSRVALLTGDGQVVLDSHTGTVSSPIPADLVTEAMRNGEAYRWKPGEDTLQVAEKIYVNNQRNASVLVREVAADKRLNQIEQVQLQGTMRSILLAIVVGIIPILALWLLGLRPMEQIRAVVQSVSEGDLSQRVPPQAVVEMDRIGSAVNLMLERLDTQHSQLQGMNRRLEQSNAAQAQEIERTSHDLAQRVAGFEAITAIFNAASVSTSMQELAENALGHIQRSMGADYAWIALNNNITLGSFPDEASRQSASLADFVHDKYDTNLYVPDWLSSDLPDNLEPISKRLLIMEIRATASVAVRTGTKAIGRIDIASKQPNFWSPSDFALLEVIGQQLGVAIGWLEDYEKSLGNSALMSRLVELSGLLNRPLSLDDVIATIGKGAVDLSGAQRVVIFQRVSDGGISPLWQHNTSRRLIRSLVARTRSDPSFFLPANQMAYSVADINLLPEEKADWWQLVGLGIRSYASWPLISEGDLSAVVVCFHERPLDYSQIEADVLDTFMRQAAIALRNARLLQSEHQQRLLAESLRDITGVLTSTLDINEVIERILTNITRVVEHDAANVMLLSGDVLNIVRSRGQPLEGVHLEEWREPIRTFKILGQVRVTGKAIAVPDTQREPNWVARPESEWIRSYATAPIRSRGKVFGFVNVSSKQAGFYSEVHANLLQAFADQASIAMENANLFARTRAVAAETNTLLRALDPLFTAGNDLALVSETITQAVVREFSQAHCSLLLVDRSHGLLKVFRESGKFLLGMQNLPLDGPGLTVAAAVSGETIYAPDVTQDPRYIKGVEDVRSELAIPLIAGGDVVGVLNVESLVVDDFSDQSRRMLMTFADRAAWVVANATLFQSTREIARQTTLLNEITQVALSGGGDTTTVLKSIVRRVAGLVEADGCYMTRWEEATQQTIPLVAFGPGEDLYANDIPEPGERNLTFALMEKGQPIAIEDAQASPLIPRDVVDKFPVRSMLGVPLQVNSHKLGALLVAFTRPYRFIPAEIEVIKQAAGQIALILSRLNSLSEAQKRAEQSERLRRASAALTTTLDATEVARLLMDHLASLVQHDTMLVGISRPTGFKPLAQRNIPMGDEVLETLFPLDDAILVEISHNASPLFLKDAQKDPRFLNWGGTTEVHSWLGVPMLAGNQIVGMAALGRYAVRSFSSDDLLLAQVLCNQAGVALQNALLHTHQQQLAMTDPLTGLYNRRGFFELARHELERSRRFNRPLSMMMIDVDHFKNVNDLYGHAVGDEVLRELAERFRSVMRESDLLCRYGGEEFCFLLPESDCQGLCVAGERVLEVVSAKPYSIQDIQVHITVSIGVTTLSLASTSLEALIQQADQSLYRAKQAGRNRVETFTPALE